MSGEIRGPGSHGDAHHGAVDVPPIANQSEAHGKNIGLDCQPERSHDHAQNGLGLAARAAHIRGREVDRIAHGKRQHKQCLGRWLRRHDEYVFIPICRVECGLQPNPCVNTKSTSIREGISLKYQKVLTLTSPWPLESARPHTIQDLGRQMPWNFLLLNYPPNPGHYC